MIRKRILGIYDMLLVETKRKYKTYAEILQIQISAFDLD